MSGTENIGHLRVLNSSTSYSAIFQRHLENFLANIIEDDKLEAPIVCVCILQSICLLEQSVKDKYNKELTTFLAEPFQSNKKVYS